ncbi:site-specific DNA-methyltransferase [Acinetobacter corruptisaponis]|uniref:Methyltransferase n=1 Tax=Acinetobacter corruptisaponis TaxID=3045147 RepID=A0ABY8S4Y1_9GAMM|nr:site-specific DNA-methyltransferase [Acinetobacter sp. KCTC 92772]WHP06755.1 site-specific DNA-methyltransferase [Acinetobacter sp. KCTC 92772]
MKHESFEPKGSFFMLNENVQLGLGDCLELLKSIPDNSIDSIVTDPPYGLKFMGKKWDYDVPSVEIWVECLRVLKPGGHLLAFAGTRTHHRMACNIEDAGFEIRDMIAWAYGSGFPKSHNLKNDWQGWGTALKPALEPITVARKPFKGTVTQNVLLHGTGAINIDECRVKHGDDVDITAIQRQQDGTDNGFRFAKSKIGKDVLMYKPQGRWPANLIHDGSDEVLACFPETKSGGGNKHPKAKSTFMASTERDNYAGTSVGGDAGSAARFFYCAKASKKDRGENNKHPTVKPHELMKYLCRLITPPNGTVLDPFMGSGSTGKAAIAHGFKFIGIEREQEYFNIAKGRITNANSNE